MTTSFGSKVKGFPEAYVKPNGNSMASSIEKRTDMPWIVYSDRADNYTTTTPGGTLLMEKMSFLEPYYVSEEKEGYVKLLKYKPNMVKGRKLNDKKTAESVGWINMQKLLLWNRSYVTKGSDNANKAIVIPNNVDPLIAPQYYFDDHDSVFVYDTPDLKNPIGKVGLHEYAYIYKQTPNARQYLIGTSDQFVLKEKAKYIKGWVSSNVISNWGNKLYLAPISYEETIRDAAMQSVNVKFALDPYFFSIDPLVDTLKIVQSALALGTEGNAYYPLPVYDKTNNQVTTINGAQLSYNGFLSLMKNRSKVNVIYIIDGGSAMRTRFPSLINTIQSFEKTITTVFRAKDVTYGSVIYRSKNHCNSGNAYLGLTKDYRSVVSFLKKQSEITANCAGYFGSEPLLDGIEEAIGLVSNVSQQTNLFVVIGSVGNNLEAVDFRVSSISQKLANVDGRLLMMQSYNESNNLFSDFIVQSRMLISKGANLAAESRKFQSVQGDAFGTNNYNFNLLDSISYFLDFPKNSMIQGGVVFPSRNSSLNSKVYNDAFLRILNDTKYDINTHISSLIDAFRLAGAVNKNVSSYVRLSLADEFTTQVGDNMPHNQFNYFNYRPYTTENLSELYSYNLEYNLILNEREYKEFLEGLSILIGENLRGDDPNFRNKLYKNYDTLFRSKLGNQSKKTPIIKLTISKYFELILGLPIEPSIYSGIMVKSLNRNKELSNSDFEEYIKYLQIVSRKIKDFSANEGKFYSNGEAYYRVKGSSFY